MKKIIKKKIFLLSIISVVLLPLLILFLPLAFIPNSIANFYQKGDETIFISNDEIVKSPDFMKGVEINALHFDLFSPKYSVIYKADNYKELDKAIIGDFLYLKRKNLLFWEVERYETTYLPYYESNDYSYDQAKEDYKNQILSGNVTYGLTPEEEKELNSKINSEYPTKGELIDYISSPTGDITVEVLAGSKQGTNYLTLNNKELGINNILRGTFSTDGTIFLYTTGHYNDMLGELIPNADIWTSDLKGNNKKIFDIEESLNDITFISNGKQIIYGTKNQIGKINLDGSGNIMLKEFQETESNNEVISLPEFITITNNKLTYKLSGQSTISTFDF